MKLQNKSFKNRRQSKKNKLKFLIQKKNLSLLAKEYKKKMKTINLLGIFQRKDSLNFNFLNPLKKVLNFKSSKE